MLSLLLLISAHVLSPCFEERESSLSNEFLFLAVGGESNPPHVYLKLVFGVLVEISPSCTEEAPPFHIHIAIKENQASKVSTNPK